MDRLKALSVFKTIVDKGGFARAAQALGMSCAQVTRSVQDLEALLGVQLLQRTTRRVSLTGIGQDVLSRASSLLESYEELASLSRTSAREPTGLVRVVAPTWYGHHFLAPVVAQFRSRFPEVSIDLRLSNEAPDLVADEADLALCRQEDLRPSFVARRLAEAEVGLFASPGYLARKGMPGRPADLLEHDCLSCTELQSGTSWCFSDVDGERYELSGKGSLCVNQAEMLMNLAAHGAGVAMLPTFMADKAVAQGRLVRLLPNWQSAPLTLHLVYGSRRNQAMAVRMLIEHLVESLYAKPEPKQGLHPVSTRQNADDDGPPSLNNPSALPAFGRAGPSNHFRPARRALAA
jgi:DNA-binding transcriptional LysR family regulator